MSISKVGFHYLTEDPYRTVNALKNAEKAAMRNSSRPSTKLFLSNTFPKGVIIQYDNLVSAFPFVPDFGTSEYLSWLTFNVKKNSYAQQFGSLAVFQDDSGDTSYEVEFWKDATKTCEINLDNDSLPSVEETRAFGKRILTMMFPNRQFIEPPNSFANAEEQLRYFEKLLGIPLVNSYNLESRHTLIGETKFMKIMRPVSTALHE